MDNRSIQWLQRELKMTCGNAESTAAARSEAVSSIIALSVKHCILIFSIIRYDCCQRYSC